MYIIYVSRKPYSKMLEGKKAPMWFLKLLLNNISYY